MQPAKLDEAWRAAERLGREMARLAIAEKLATAPVRTAAKPN